MDLICFSNIRWDYVHRRPHHLLNLFSSNYRIFYIEEPMFGFEYDHLSFYNRDRLWVIKMRLKGSPEQADALLRQKKLVYSLFNKMAIRKYFFWIYTPALMPVAEEFSPEFLVYDCIEDHDSRMESKLIANSDLIFTGSERLYKHKKNMHFNVHNFPNSVDKRHFSRSQTFIKDPFDQEKIPHPRIGYFGVLNDRLDIDLLEQLSYKRPDWQFIFIGPKEKIIAGLPSQRKNIHYLGLKKYKELPGYIAGWDLGMIPYKVNRRTGFNGSAKTAEFLSGYIPVISTPVNDITSRYGMVELINVVRNPDEFISVVEKVLRSEKTEWKKNVNTFLSGISWKITYKKMLALIEQQLFHKYISKTPGTYASHSGLTL